MTLIEFRQLFHGPLIGNCGYTKETVEKAIAEGWADLIALGRPFISNPDLVECFERGWPVAPVAPISDWYSPIGKTGYSAFRPVRRNQSTDTQATNRLMYLSRLV